MVGLYIKKLLSFLYLLIIGRKNEICTYNALLFKSRLTILKDNRLTIKNWNLTNVDISVRGEENRIVLDGESNGGSIITNTSILIEGKGCQLMIQSGVNINNAKIVIRGSDCIVSINQRSTIGSGIIVCIGQSNTVAIGEECMLAENIDIWASDSHPILDCNSKKIINPSGSIVIENHVWLGKGVAVLKNVRIGHDSVIGMNSTVTSNIPVNSLAVGSPAKTIKRNITWQRNFIEI